MIAFKFILNLCTAVWEINSASKVFLPFLKIVYNKVKNQKFISTMQIHNSTFLASFNLKTLSLLVLIVWQFPLSLIKTWQNFQQLFVLLKVTQVALMHLLNLPWTIKLINSLISNAKIDGTLQARELISLNQEEDVN